MKKILLVYPRCKYPSGQPPLGLGALSAYLKAVTADSSIDLFDATFVKNSRAAFETCCAAGNYDALLFSVMTSMSRDAHAMAVIAKRVLPRSTVVFGGPHPTVLPELCLKDNNVDIVVRGEGETVIGCLAARGFHPGDCPGVVYRSADNRIIYNPPQPLIGNLDDLPIPDRSLFDMGRYIGAWNSMDCVAPGLRGTSVIVSRGCPYRCAFCQPTLETMFGKKIRTRSPGLVVKELQYLRDAYAINAFMFEDDTLAMDRQWVLEMCALLKSGCPGMLWCCNMRADLCDEPLLRAMFNAGLRKVNIGMETASQALLDTVYKKGISIQEIKEAVARCKRVGLRVQGYFMIGHPRETTADMHDTLRFARRLPIDDVSISIVTPFPGTALYDQEHARIAQPFEAFDYYGACVFSQKFLAAPAGTIRRMKSMGYLAFYARPSRLLTQARILFSIGGIRKMLYKLQRVL